MKNGIPTFADFLNEKIDVPNFIDFETKNANKLLKNLDKGKIKSLRFDGRKFKLLTAGYGDIAVEDLNTNKKIIITQTDSDKHKYDLVTPGFGDFYLKLKNKV